ncbi:MAG: diguanylate cyclase, partial [Deltaproteobacteria bacterium]|nr:diguanylate cyclase [Deltaproteobacteria bacterium]
LRSDETPPTLIVGDHYSAPLLARCMQVGTAGLHSKTDAIESLIERVIAIIRDDAKRARVEESASKRVAPGGVDPLTRIGSKEHFFRRLSAESVASYREGNNLSLLIFEVDRYERIVDRNSRQKAESLLAQVALLVEGELRSRDCVARYSDYSFGVVLPESAADAAAAVGRRLRATIAASEFGDLDHPIAVTISVGAACRRSGMRASPDEMTSLAVKNCAAATQMGGDRLVADALLTGMPLALVIAEASETASQLVADLERCNVEARLVHDTEQAIGTLDTLPAALIVAVHPQPGSGKDILVWARDRQPAARRVLVSATSGEELLGYAVNRAGVHYFLAAPWPPGSVDEMVDRLLFG